ncbi:MAG: hypothetical protein LBS86_06950, partial [Treponema sp.]|nr:hypothetical protein [Treponema sp.]
MKQAIVAAALVMFLMSCSTVGEHWNLGIDEPAASEKSAQGTATTTPQGKEASSTSASSSSYLDSHSQEVLDRQAALIEELRQEIAAVREDSAATRKELEDVRKRAETPSSATMSAADRELMRRQAAEIEALHQETAAIRKAAAQN